MPESTLSTQHDAQNQKEMAASGSVTTNDRVAAFLYDLMRDHLPTGTVERMIRDNTLGLKNSNFIMFTNGHLARIAIDMADRLRSQD